MSNLDRVFESRLAARHRLGRVFGSVCMASTWFGIGVLVVLLIGVVWQAAGWLDWDFLTNFDSRHPEQAGILAGLWGSLWLILLTTLFSVPTGIGAALYLEEYARNSWLKRLIQINQETTRLVIKGWVATREPVKDIHLRLGGRQYSVEYGVPRQDIAARFQHPEYFSSGFHTTIPLIEVTPGYHSLVLKVSLHSTIFCRSPGKTIWIHIQ